MWKNLAIVCLALAVQSCELVGNFLHDDQRVAKLYGKKLYRSEVEAFIPEYVTSEDSLVLARNYVNTWASEILYTRMAEEYLSKQEKDINDELEAYRQSLLKFRYEQHFISDRLDTAVTSGQMREYYDSHGEVFELERPVLKYLFLEIGEKSPYLDELSELLTSHIDTDRNLLDSLVYLSTSRFIDCSGVWTDASVLAKEYSADCSGLISLINNSVIRVSDAERGTVKLTYVCDAVYSGTAPYDFCKEKIRNLVLSSRKRELLVGLEQDLLESAKKNKSLVIY